MEKECDFSFIFYSFSFKGKYIMEYKHQSLFRAYGCRSYTQGGSDVILFHIYATWLFAAIL